MPIAQSAVGTSPTTIYTSSGETATTVILLMNDHVSAVVVQVYVVPNGGTAQASTQIIKDLSIDAADTYILNTEKFILSNGDTVQVTADTASAVYATTSYVDV